MSMTPPPSCGVNMGAAEQVVERAKAEPQFLQRAQAARRAYKGQRRQASEAARDLAARHGLAAGQRLCWSPPLPLYPPLPPHPSQHFVSVVNCVRLRQKLAPARARHPLFSISLVP